MNETRDTNESAPADEGGRDPQAAAAALLEQTRRQARRQFEVKKPLLSLIGGPNLGVALAVIAIGAGSAFAGPACVWAFAGVSCCVALLGHAAAQVWLRRPRIMERA